MVKIYLRSYIQPDSVGKDDYTFTLIQTSIIAKCPTVISLEWSVQYTATVSTSMFQVHFLLFDS